MNRRNFLKLAGVGIAAPCLPVAKAAATEVLIQGPVNVPETYLIYGGRDVVGHLATWDAEAGWTVIRPLTADEFYKPVF